MAVINPENRGLRLAIRYFVLCLIAVIFIFPLIFMMMSSLKPTSQLLADTSSLRAFLPVGDISLANYADAFERAPVGLFIFNSVLVTGTTVLLSLFFHPFAFQQSQLLLFQKILEKERARLFQIVRSELR